MSFLVYAKRNVRKIMTIATLSMAFTGYSMIAYELMTNPKTFLEAQQQNRNFRLLDPFPTNTRSKPENEKEEK